MLKPKLHNYKYNWCVCSHQSWSLEWTASLHLCGGRIPHPSNIFPHKQTVINMQKSSWLLKSLHCVNVNNTDSYEQLRKVKFNRGKKNRTMLTHAFPISFYSFPRAIFISDRGTQSFHTTLEVLALRNGWHRHSYTQMQIFGEDTIKSLQANSSAFLLHTNTVTIHSHLLISILIMHYWYRFISKDEWMLELSLILYPCWPPEDPGHLFTFTPAMKSKKAQGVFFLSISPWLLSTQENSGATHSCLQLIVL